MLGPGWLAIIAMSMWRPMSYLTSGIILFTKKVTRLVTGDLSLAHSS